jgi:hypothetical protein
VRPLPFENEPLADMQEDLQCRILAIPWHLRERLFELCCESSVRIQRPELVNTRARSFKVLYLLASGNLCLVSFSRMTAVNSTESASGRLGSTLILVGELVDDIYFSLHGPGLIARALLFSSFNSIMVMAFASMSASNCANRNMFERNWTFFCISNFLTSSGVILAPIRWTAFQLMTFCVKAVRPLELGCPGS